EGDFRQSLGLYDIGMANAHAPAAREFSSGPTSPPWPLRVQRARARHGLHPAERTRTTIAGQPLARYFIGKRMNESLDNERYGVPALAGFVLPLKAARNIQYPGPRSGLTGLKPGSHTLTI